MKWTNLILLCRKYPRIVCFVRLLENEKRGEPLVNSGLVFSIEEFSVFDGPGRRTTVFLMGCPLRCAWCHSPEGQGFENFILRAPNGCANCGACRRHAVMEEGRLIYTKESIDNCPNNLLRYCAVRYTPEELCAKLEKNAPILSANGGGVTFSGGEPTASPSFLVECLRLLEGKLHRAIQTCGACSPDLFSEILENCDFVLFDIKLVDEKRHQQYTGVSNRNILENFKRLVSFGKEFIIRTPLIPGVTDTEENIEEIARLLSAHGVRYIELLPYNKLTGAKYALVNREYAPEFDGSRPVEFRTELFARYGIKTKIL